MSNRDLIRRARKLAKLREKAIPGPYSHHRHHTGIEIAILDVEGEVITWYEQYFDGDTQPEIFSASWEMAELLDKLADALEAAERRGLTAQEKEGKE